VSAATPLDLTLAHGASPPCPQFPRFADFGPGYPRRHLPRKVLFIARQVL
jgi:hypothetical protein